MIERLNRQSINILKCWIKHCTLNCFFGCAAISDLYLFQYIILLNLCFKFSNNLMLLFEDKVTTGT